MFYRLPFVCDARRGAVSHLLTLWLAVVVLSACDRSDPARQHPEKQPVVEAQPAPAEPPPTPALWYEGTWRATAILGGHVAVDQHNAAADPPAQPENQAAAEPITLKLVVNKAGQATGTLTTRSGSSRVAGLKDEDDVLRLQVSGEQYYGTLVCRRAAEQFVGQLVVSGAGTMDLDLKPPRFGVSANVTLTRALD